MMKMEKTLATMIQDESGTISRMEGGDEFKRKLRNIGIREGKRVTLVTKQYFGGPIVLKVDGRETSIGRGMARRIFVDV